MGAAHPSRRSSYRPPMYDLRPSPKPPPEFGRELPKEEWAFEREPSRSEQKWNDSAKAVRTQ